MKNGYELYSMKKFKTEEPKQLKHILKRFEQVETKYEEDDADDDIKKVKAYINANYINGLISNHSMKSIIACQAPV